MGSDAYCNDDGTIAYTTWRDLPQEALLSPKYVRVSWVHPQADIYAPFTRYQEHIQLVTHVVKKDGGRVEVAIRNMDHILESVEGQEKEQAHVVRWRASELFDLFQKNFSDITPEEFEAKRAETYRRLQKARLNPDTVYNHEKKRMTYYLVKGSYGHDSTGRENWLISVGALSAAHRIAIERELGLGEIAGKFIRMREALVIIREFDRGMLEEVIGTIRPTNMPSHPLFTKPEQPPVNLGPTLGLLQTAIFKLSQTHVKPYRPAALEAIPALKEVQTLVGKNRRVEVMKRGLFATVHALLDTTLRDHVSIYPSQANQ